MDVAAPKLKFFIFFSPNNLATRTTKKWSFLKIIRIYFLINFSFFSNQNMYNNRLTMQGVLRKPKIYVTNKKSTRHHHSRNIKSSFFVLEDFFIFNYSVSSSLVSRRKSSSSFFSFLHNFLSIIISRRSNLFFRKGSKY